MIYQSSSSSDTQINTSLDVQQITELLQQTSYSLIQHWTQSESGEGFAEYSVQ